MASGIFKSKLSKANAWLLAICLIVIVAILSLDFFSYRHLTTIQESLDSLSNSRTSVKTLIKANEELAIAENRFKLFVLGGDSASLIIAQQNLDSALRHLDQLEKVTDSSVLEDLKENINSKIELTKNIAKLRLGADSMHDSLFFVRIKQLNKQEIKLKKIDTRILKKFYVVDTLKAVKKKKSFFKKLSGLFSNKEDDVQYKLAKGDSSNLLNDSTLAENENLKNLADSIQQYYQKNINKQIKNLANSSSKEKRLIETNLHIIEKIHDVLEDLVRQNKEKDKARMDKAYEKGASSEKAMLQIFYFSFIVILIIIAILIYNAKKSIQYEQDILQAKNKAEKLAQTKARFLSNMSHEIRSPLTAIIGFTEQLEKNETDTSKLKQLNAIHSSSEHLLNTVNEILDFSKLDAGKLTIQKGNFNLSKEIEDVFYSCSVLANKKNLAFNLNKELASDSIVFADVHRLRQVLYNLINNAIKFTENGSVTVAVKTIKTGSKDLLLKIDVIDTGVGIPKDQIGFIFEEFAQASTNNIDNRKAIKGTGLGLAITKMLVQLQNGQIAVSSEVKKGSTFSVTLPMQLADEGAVLIEKATTVIKSDYATKKALVIEDNEINIMLLTLLLKKYNIQYDVAKDGEAGLELFSNNHYDILLTDINIPKLTGDRVALAIRKNTDTQKASIPIVALTASIVTDEVDMYQRSGINEVMMKPFKEAEFSKVLSKYLSD